MRSRAGETATRLHYDVGLEATLRLHDLVEQAARAGQGFQLVPGS